MAKAIIKRRSAAPRTTKQKPARKPAAPDNKAEREQLDRIYEALCDANSLFIELSDDFERVPDTVRIAACRMKQTTSEPLDGIDELMDAAGCFEQKAEGVQS